MCRCYKSQNAAASHTNGRWNQTAWPGRLPLQPVTFAPALQGHQLAVCFLQLQTGVNIVKNEGFLALYSGLGPAIGRGLFYGGQLRLTRLP